MSNNSLKGFATENWVLKHIQSINKSGSSSGTSIQAIVSSVTWDKIQNKPTTLNGYGITDAMSNSHPANGITSALITNWNTAYSNNHTHSNKSVLDGITSDLITKWNNMLPLTGGTLTGDLNGTNIIASGNVTANKIYAPEIVFGDGASLKYDETSGTIHATAGFWSSQFVSAYGINTGGTVTADTDVFVKSLDFVDGKIKVNYGSVSDITDITNLTATTINAAYLNVGSSIITDNSATLVINGNCLIDDEGDMQLTHGRLCIGEAMLVDNGGGAILINNNFNIDEFGDLALEGGYFRVGNSNIDADVKICYGGNRYSLNVSAAISNGILTKD